MLSDASGENHLILYEHRRYNDCSSYRYFLTYESIKLPQATDDDRMIWRKIIDCIIFCFFIITAYFEGRRICTGYAYRTSKQK
jgi:hypothetical protein